ncbi:MAG: ROK family protein [Acidobacteriota bacterium]
MRIGVDLGGTKIEGVALALDGRPLARRRVPTPRGDYEGTIGAIVGLVRHLETEVGATGTVGVGTPGSLSPSTGLMRNANSTWLNGRALAEDLPRALGRPVRFANDANCFALSEAVDGAGAGADVVFGVIVGTGTGGGVVVRGHVLEGANGVAGEWGHNPLPWPDGDERPGAACYCGRSGCIETFLSGPGLARDFRLAGGDAADGAEVAARASAGQPEAVEALDRYVDRMARALASIINVVDPDVIVLGGGLSNIDRLYQDVPARWGRYVFSDAVVTRLVRAAHGDAGGVRGAAWLWNV